MIINLNKTLLLDENKKKINYYSSKSLNDRVFLTKSLSSSIELSYLIMRLGLISFFAEYSLDPKWEVAFDREYCGLRTINGFSYYGFYLVPKDGYPCYAIFYLNSNENSSFLDVYIPRYGNVFDIEKKSLICASGSESKETMLGKYISMNPYFDASDEETITEAKISISCMEKDILNHFEFILTKKEEDIKKNIFRLNDEASLESLYIDALELMYLIIKESYYPLMPILYNKLDILGVFIDEKTKLYKDFIRVYNKYEEIDSMTSLSERINLMNQIKKILENY